MQDMQERGAVFVSRVNTGFWPHSLWIYVPGDDGIIAFGCINQIWTAAEDLWEA